MERVIARLEGHIPQLSLKTRDVSFKARSLHNYGCNAQTYDDIIKYKDIWQKSLFYVDEELLAKNVAAGNIQIKPLITLNDTELNLRDPIEDPMNEISHDDSIDFTIQHVKKSSEETIKYGQSIPLTGRNGLLLYTGGQITSVSWLQKPLDNFEDFLYLAVSVIHNPLGLSNTVSNHQLSIFPKTVELTLNSSIQIWKYHYSSNSAEIVKTYDVSNFGTSPNLQWLQIYTKDDNSLGALIGTFGDGNLHLFKVVLNDVPFVKVAKPSLTYSAPGGNNEASIICFDTFEYNKLMVGMSNGCVAEYILPFLNFEEGLDLDISIPSFVFRIETSPINSLMVAEPEPSKFIVIANTTGYQGLIFEYDNFIQGRCATLSVRGSTKPIFNHALKLYVSTMSDSLYYNYARTAQDKSNNIYKTDAFVVSSTLSNILSHPLNISGTSDGDVIVVDYSRKVLHGSKSTKKILVPLKLWKLRVIDNKLTVFADFEPITSDPSTQSPLSPPEVVISSVAWNENILGSSVYAAGSISGLLIIERLDPSKY